MCPFDYTAVAVSDERNMVGLEKSRGGNNRIYHHVAEGTIYHVDEVMIGKPRGMNPLVLTEPWRGPDGRFIPRARAVTS